MVRLEYGFNGYQVPPTPRAARSARRRCLFKRKADDRQMCAFDVLATVAGKLLLDGETANTSCGKEQLASVEDPIGKEDNAKPLEHKSCGRGYYERNFLITELVSDATDLHYCPNELSCAQNDETSRPASGITSSDSSDKAGSVEHLVNDDCKLRLGIFSSSLDVELSGFRVSANSESEGENRKRVKVCSAVTRNVSIGNKPALCGSGDQDDWDRKPPAFVNSFDSVKFPFCKDDSPSGSIPVIRDHVKLVNRDDDENSSECNGLITRNKAFKPPPHFGDSKFRKFPASKECKITPGTKDGKPYNADVERCNYFNRKTALKSQRSVRDYPFKKRKLFGSDSLSNSGERTNCDGIRKVPENRLDGGGLGSSPAVPAAMATPTSPRGGHASFQSRNTQVKIKIKSFRVPELLIEMPEAATVGSLKRTVLEAITTVLGGGLRVGVVLQGKKIRDDNKTLLQAGISQDSKMDSLGFSLEPSLALVPLRSYPDTRPVQLTPDKPQALSRCSPPPVITQNSIQHGDLDSSPDIACSSSFNNFIESDHDSAPSPTGMSLHRRNTDSKALVPSSATKLEVLSVMPLRKCKRSESTQRRIRRPFTVAEVESLVQAVEKLGTGRWRDVKLRAFDNAKHRTYVDLKDKWKTLVHTARISPQQRRGEPVPQELLDRVLTAHAYWSQQQAKHQLKAQPDTCLL